MDLPTVLSEHVYNRTNNTKSSHVLCDGSHYHKVESKIVQKSIIPGMKTVCEILAYIVPIQCHTWKRSEAVISQQGSFLNAPTPGVESSRDKSQTPQLRNFRSGCFTIIVGRGRTASEPILYNWFTELDRPYTGMGARTKLFVLLQVTNTGNNSCEIIGTFMLVPPIATIQMITKNGDLPIAREVQRSIFYSLLRLGRKYQALQSPDCIENMLFQLIYNEGLVWFEICTYCIQKTKLPLRRGGERLRDWMGSPDQEHILVALIFPNSSIISGHGATLGNIAGYRPLLFRHTYPGHLTLLFKPLTSGNGNYFLTCHGAEEAGLLSMNGLISVFDYSTWAWILITLFLLPALLLGRFWQIGLSDILLNSISVLLEQGCLENTSKWPRWACGVLLLAGVTLSNVYRGDNITSLTAPLPKESLERFEQLFQRNFTYFVSFQFANIFKQLGDKHPLGRIAAGGATNGFLETIVKTTMRRSVFMQLCGNQNSEPSPAAIAVLDKVIWPNNSSAMFGWSDSTAYLPLLARCGKQAFVGYHREVEILSQKLSGTLLSSGKNKEVVSLSKESFSQVGPAWNLQGIPMPLANIFRRVHLLWQSGLMDVWDALSLRIQTWNTTLANAVSSYQAKMPKKLALGDNTIAIFYMYLAQTAVPVLVFFKETLVYIQTKRINKTCIAKNRVQTIGVPTWLSFITCIGIRKSQAFPEITVVSSQLGYIW